jgi:hypothetical protein
MKITIEIDSDLIKEAQAVAFREGTTVDALLEHALNLALRERRHRGFKLRDASVDGHGLHRDAAGRPWSALISSLDRFPHDFMNERDQYGTGRKSVRKKNEDPR